MGLKIVLSWKNKDCGEFCSGGESSKDFGEDKGIIFALGIYPPDYVYGTPIQLYPWGVAIIQQFFNHQIDLNKYDYTFTFIENC